MDDPPAIQCPAENAVLRHKLRRAWADRARLHLRVRQLTRAITEAGLPLPPETPDPSGKTAAPPRG